MKNLMTSEELESIIAGGETPNLECKLAKSAIPVNFWETFSAFANTGDTWKAEGYVQPVLKETYDPDRTWVEVEFESTEKRAESTEKSTGIVAESTEKSTVKFSETEERIIELMRENTHITQGMLSTRLGITRNYVAKITMSLTERGAIRRVGPDKGGVWEVLKK